MNRNVLHPCLGSSTSMIPHPSSLIPHPFSALPDADVQLQIGAKAIFDLAANQFDQAEDIAGRDSWTNHNEIGVALAHLRAAHFGLGQPGLLDQGGGIEAARVLEDAGTGLEAERLASLALNPGLAHVLDDAVRLIRFQLEFGREKHRIVKVASPEIKTQLVAFTDVDRAVAVEHGDATHMLADVTGAAAGIAAQAPPTVPEMPTSDSSPPRP